MVNAAVISEVTLNAAPEYENTLRRDPRLRSTDAVTAHLTPTPFAARHTTSVSFCHWVDAHAVAPIRTPPVQSDSPALAPYTDTLICEVEGCADGDTLVTRRVNAISGNIMFGCV